MRKSSGTQGREGKWMLEVVPLFQAPRESENSFGKRRNTKKPPLEKGFWGEGNFRKVQS